jgi:SAM-dependent methyltransferase
MAFEELKQRLAMVWGSAPFENVAPQLANIHDHLIRELDPQPGERWLDVATGTGAVATRAARAGADVTGSDLAPVLIETAKRLAAEDGLTITYEVADAEELPYGDGTFDVVSSSFGVMFAPDHVRAARQLARVTRAGGRIGLSAWDPAGGLGDFFRLMGRFQPQPPEGVGNPLDWGREEHAQGLLGDDFDLRFVHGDDRKLEDPEEMWEVSLESFGPMKMLWGSLDQARRQEFRGAYMDYMERYRKNGGVEAPAEYLLILGTRR